MANPSDVSDEEVDDAFYRSYGEGSAGGLDPKLVDGATLDRRKLGLTPEDAEFRECWMETRRLMREAKGYCPPKGGVLGAPVTSCPLAARNSDRPKYEPDLWNDEGPIQTSTNCYAYAVDSRTGHPEDGKPQPGEKSSTHMPRPLSCEGISGAVLEDGRPSDILSGWRCPYNKQQQKPPPEKAGYYLVALVKTSKPTGYDEHDGVFYINDYHWYRQDEDGMWSHKPGHRSVTCTDAIGNVISNPQTAARRSTYEKEKFVWTFPPKYVDLVIDYDVFCGYFYVKKGGVKVGP